MGLLSLLCCVKRREGSASSGAVEYSHETSSPQNEKASKEPMRETTHSVKEPTPPPVYSAKSQSKTEAVIATASVPSSPPRIKQEVIDEEVCVIKEEPNAAHLVPYQGQTFDDSKAYEEPVKAIKDEKCMPFAENVVPFPAPLQPYVFVAGGRNVPKPSEFAPSSSTALTTTTFPAPTAVFGLTSTPNRTTSNQGRSAPLALPSSTAFPSSAPTAVFGLSQSSNNARVPQSSASTLPSSSAVVPSSPPTSRFTLLNYNAAPPVQSSPPPLFPSTAITIPSNPAPPRQTFTATTVHHTPLPGTCPQCGSLNNIHYTSSTSNGNYNRPFRKCPSCSSWNGFADQRGITPGTLCWCDDAAAMRLVAKNARDGQGRRQAFYSCQFKACGAWSNHTDGMGEATWFTEGEIERMVGEGRI